MNFLILILFNLCLTPSLPFLLKLEPEELKHICMKGLGKLWQADYDVRKFEIPPQTFLKKEKIKKEDNDDEETVPVSLISNGKRERLLQFFRCLQTHFF